MEFKKYDILKFKNGEYLVLDIIDYNNNKYLYLINNNEYLNDTSITKVIDNNGVIEYIEIENNDEFNIILNKLFINAKKGILKLFENEVPE